MSINASLILESIEFADLPIDKSHPTHSAWVWGPDDGLGTLNYLGDELVNVAAKEIQTGQRVCMNWDMTHPRHPGFGRQKFEHQIVRKSDRIVCDDVVHFNTQHSSQWDGFRHFGYQKEKVFYNNCTVPQVLNEAGTQSGKGMQLGMGAWAIRGIAGRAVLLDIFTYCETHGQAYDPWSTHGVSLDVIKSCAEHQKVQFKRGDILILRTGYHTMYERATDDQIKDKSTVNPPRYAGVAQDLAIAEWVYNNKFAAVAGDAPAFESWPPKQTSTGYSLHEIFLGGWGMPIGELWYLERLKDVCHELGRWTFFLSSSPLNVPGGVATPPNAMAIF